MAEPVIPLIMCGGAGTRLWPASREGRPKQFLSLFGKHSTFQETLRRVSDPAVFGRPIVITNGQYRFIVAEQLAEAEIEADILLEPARRDSGPAIAAGAAFALQRGDDPIVVALAADHVVTDTAGLRCRLPQRRAMRPPTARSSPSACAPTGRRPNTAISVPARRIGERCLRGREASSRSRTRRPPRAISREGYLWNSGNFVFRAGVFLDEYRAFEPKTVDAAQAAIEKAGIDLGFVTLDKAAFERRNANSIDYAVMEKTKRAAVVPVSYGWSDVGSWHAVWELSARDAAGNSSHGTALFLESRNSYASSEKALVALFGVEDLVVVASEDAVLIANRADTNGMKRLVEKLKEVAPTVTVDHIKMHRPWGNYQSLDNGDRYQVKRIVVKRGGRLSLQYHNHRSEHWVVVRGTARVTLGDQVKMLQENESIYIPLGTPHRLENPGKIDLELIEVQTGSYLGEDDIIRIEDDYRRS